MTVPASDDQLKYFDSVFPWDRKGQRHNFPAIMLQFPNRKSLSQHQFIHTNALNHVLRGFLLPTNEALVDFDRDLYQTFYNAAYTLIRRPKQPDLIKGLAVAQTQDLIWKAGLELLARKAPYQANLEGLDEADEDVDSFLSQNTGQNDKAARRARAHNLRISNARKLLKFMTQLGSVAKAISVDHLKEQLLYLMLFGMLDSAYDRFQSYIQKHPYNEDAELVGYCGLICYLMWLRDMKISELDRASVGKRFLDERQFTDESGPFPELPSNADLSSRFYLEGLQYFQVSFDINPTNDLFLFHHIHMLLAARRVEACRTLIEGFIERNPNNVNVYQYLYFLLDKYYTDSGSNVYIAEAIFNKDPLSTPQTSLIPIITHYEAVASDSLRSDDMNDDTDNAESTQAYSHILSILAQRLDYDQGEPWMWVKLAVTLTQLQDAQDNPMEEMWKSRRDLWPSLHFSYFDKSLPQEHAIIKGICALLMFPDSYPALAWPSTCDISPDNLKRESLAILEFHGVSKEDFFTTSPRPLASCFLPLTVAREEERHGLHGSIERVDGLGGIFDMFNEELSRTEGTTEELNSMEANTASVLPSTIDSHLPPDTFVIDIEAPLPSGNMFNEELCRTEGTAEEHDSMEANTASVLLSAIDSNLPPDTPVIDIEAPLPSGDAPTPRKKKKSKKSKSSKKERTPKKRKRVIEDDHSAAEEYSRPEFEKETLPEPQPVTPKRAVKKQKRECESKISIANEGFTEKNPTKIG
ncbi:hypothetical protein DFS34DRAFT_589352 [Phlyctochytrium arcticum]|nr:hypothetical protein DFS34DRAFT_589352 [Phlyctochytrium arcticum]